MTLWRARQCGLGSPEDRSSLPRADRFLARRHALTAELRLLPPHRRAPHDPQRPALHPDRVQRVARPARHLGVGQLAQQGHLLGRPRPAGRHPRAEPPQLRSPKLLGHLFTTWGAGKKEALPEDRPLAEGLKLLQSPDK